MNLNPSNSIPTFDLPRCQHRTPGNRRCRLAVERQTSSFCSLHSGLHQENPDTADLAPALLGGLTEIDTAQDMKYVLAKLFLLLAQNRISTKKAATLAYIIQQLRSTLPAIQWELNLAASDASSSQEIVWDLTRPDYSKKVCTS